MIQNVQQYLDNAYPIHNTRDRTDITVIVKATGAAASDISMPKTEFACDAAIWTVQTKHALLEELKAAADPEKALDELAHNVILTVARSWQRHAQVYRNDIDCLHALVYARDAGVPENHSQTVQDAVREYLRRLAIDAGIGLDEPGQETGGRA